MMDSTEDARQGSLEAGDLEHRTLNARDGTVWAVRAPSTADCIRTIFPAIRAGGKHWDKFSSELRIVNSSPCSPSSDTDRTFITFAGFSMLCGNICGKTLRRWSRHATLQFPEPVTIGAQQLYHFDEVLEFITRKNAEAKASISNHGKEPSRG